MRIFLISCAMALLLSMAIAANANTVVITGSIDTQEEVDQWIVSLGAESDLTIDVMAYEGCGSGHSVDFIANVDDVFGNGAYNDHLLSSFYLFTSSGILVGSANSMYYSGRGRHDTQSGQDPYLILTGVAAGNYVLAIGQVPLVEEDAWAGINGDGSSWEPDFFHNYQTTLAASTDTLQVIPEPTTALLLACGLSGLALRRRLSA